MKNSACVVATVCLTFTLMLYGSPVDASQERILEIRKLSVSSKATDDLPAVAVSAVQSKSGDRVTSLRVVIADQRHDVPNVALKELPPIKLNSLQIRTEAGFTGERWFTIVFAPTGRQATTTWYSISIVGNRYLQTTKSWDSKEGDAIHRNVDVLHSVTPPQ